MTSTIAQLQFTSRLASIAEATERAVEIARRLGYGDDALFGIDMAVREAVTNAVVHGNREDETKTVDVTFVDESRILTITVRDYGRGFRPEDVPDPTATENLLATNGRGILFMRNFMDTVEWSNHPQGGTIVGMTKRR